MTAKNETKPRIRVEGLMELSQAMEDWLASTIADPGTNIDSGFGPGGRDLWVTVGGEEFLIRLSSVAKASGDEESKA